MDIDYGWLFGVDKRDSCTDVVRIQRRWFTLLDCQQNIFRFRQGAQVRLECHAQVSPHVHIRLTSCRKSLKLERRENGLNVNRMRELIRYFGLWNY